MRATTYVYHPDNFTLREIDAFVKDALADVPDPGTVIILPEKLRSRTERIRRKIDSEGSEVSKIFPSVPTDGVVNLPRSS